MTWTFTSCCLLKFSLFISRAWSDSTCHSAMSSVQLSVAGPPPPPTPPPGNMMSGQLMQFLSYFHYQKRNFSLFFTQIFFTQNVSSWMKQGATQCCQAFTPSILVFTHLNTVVLNQGDRYYTEDAGCCASHRSVVTQLAQNRPQVFLAEQT